MATLTDKEQIMKVLNELEKDEFAAFKWNLREADNFPDKNPLTKGELEDKDRRGVADALWQKYSDNPNNQVGLNNILKKIDRNDLVFETDAPYE